MRCTSLRARRSFVSCAKAPGSLEPATRSTMLPIKLCFELRLDLARAAAAPVCRLGSACNEGRPRLLRGKRESLASASRRVCQASAGRAVPRI